MKQIIFIFMSLLCFSCSSKAQNQTADTNVQSDKKILVAYFSCTGTTEKAADAIAKTVGGKLYQITPATAYTSADLDWNNKSSRSSIHSLRNMISPVKPLFHLLLPEEAQ